MLILVGHRFELGEFLFFDIEPQRPVGRRNPDVAVQVGVQSSSRSGHGLGREIDSDLFGFGIDPAETAAAALHVRSGIEPEDAVFIPGDAVGAGGDVSLIVELEILHRAGLAIDAGDGGFHAGMGESDPDVSVEVHLRIMHAGDMVHAGLGPERPIAAIHGCRVAVFHREVVFLEHDARRFTGRARAQLELHRAFARASRAGEISRQFLLVELDIGRRLVIRTEVDAEHVHVLHQVENLVPAFLVEPVL